MTKQIEALKLALEALRLCTNVGMIPMYLQANQTAITAIKEALAQPEQEQVEWGVDWGPDGNSVSIIKRLADGGIEVVGWEYSPHPPQRKPLTDEMTKQMRESCDSYEMRGAFVDGWLSAEAAHGIKGEA